LPHLNLSTAALIVAVVCLAVSNQPANAGTTVIGQINPPGVSPTGVTGITFDKSPNPLVIDGSGFNIWRLNVSDASTIATYPLPDPAATRTLKFDAFTHHLFNTRRPHSIDVLAIVNPRQGAVTELGTLGFFNSLDIAIHPVSGFMWMVNDCANESCTQAGGGQLWSVEKQSGVGVKVQEYGTGRGQFTALAISPTGQFYVATLIGGFTSIYQIDPDTNNATFITGTSLAQNDIISDMAFDPATGRLYAIEARRTITPNEFYLDEVTGLPSQ